MKIIFFPKMTSHLFKTQMKDPEVDTEAETVFEIYFVFSWPENKV